jgi:hypothetical protein
MVNDQDRSHAGRLRLSFVDASEQKVVGEEIPFIIGPVGAETHSFEMKVPDTAGSYSTRAVATAADDPANPTISHRGVVIEV